MPTVKRITLVIEGEVKELMDVVTVAMAGDLVREFKTEDVEMLEVRSVGEFFGRGEKHHTQRKRAFQVGDYVRVRYADEQRGLEGGEQGTITKVHFQGGRSRIDVRFDDNNEMTLPGSKVEIVRTAK